MITGAVICEFNPFHNGHKYLLDFMRKDGCDCIVCVMSTSFTQRGDVAVFSKFQRAKDALLGGADIIIELPAVWAVSSAQRFANAGCEIIKALGLVDRVYFASECGDSELLKKTADATEDENVKLLIKKYMQEGDYYPTALQKAVSDVFGADISDILSSPNNTLGIEYIKSLKGINIDIRTIKRVGVGHDCDETSDEFASGSKLRADILSGKSAEDFLPHTNAECENPAFYEYGERAMLYALRGMTRDDFEKLPDVSEGLHNRIYDSVRTENSVDAILSKIKTKRYTHARLRRIITSALIGITKEHQRMGVPYIRILGFSAAGEALIKELNITSSLPLVLNLASAINTLDKNAAEILDIEIKATDIRTVFEKVPTPCGTDFTQGIIKIR